MKFNISYSLAQESDKAPGDGADTKLVDEVPVQVDATPAVAGDDFKDDTDTSEIVAHLDTLLEIEKDMQADGPDEGVVDGFSEQEAGIEQAVAIECECQAIADELSENNRVIEITEGLQDIKTIVEQTPEGETVDIPMLQTAANMAVAGSDADAQDILPAMEAFQDKQVALEALGEKIAAATASIIDSIKGLGEKFTNVLKNIFSSINRLEESLKQREAAVRAVKGNVTFAIKGSRFLQKSQDAYVTDGADFLKELTRSVEFFTAWSATAVKSVAAFDGSIGEWYRSLGNLEKSRAATAKIYQAYVVEFGQGLRTLPGIQAVKGDKNVETFRTPTLLGGRVMEATVPRNIVDFATGSSSDIRASITQTNANFGKEYLMHNKATPTINFTLTPQQLKAIVDLDKKTLAAVKLYLNESYKRFKRWSTFMGGASEFVIPNSTLLVNKGVNHALYYTGFSRAYGESLLRSSFIVLDKAVASAGKAAPAAAAAPAAVPAAA